MDLNINIKYGDYEFRSVNASLLQIGDLNTVEMIRKTETGDAITILYWRKTLDGYNLTFVEDRPFSEIDIVSLPRVWELLHHIQVLLDSELEWQEVIEEAQNFGFGFDLGEDKEEEE